VCQQRGQHVALARASGVAPPRQGLALQVAWRSAWTGLRNHCITQQSVLQLASERA
jgi:hypothetical protein